MDRTHSRLFTRSVILFGYVIIQYQSLDNFLIRFSRRSRNSQNHERKRQQGKNRYYPTCSLVLDFSTGSYVKWVAFWRSLVMFWSIHCQHEFTAKRARLQNYRSSPACEYKLVNVTSSWCSWIKKFIYTELSAKVMPKTVGDFTFIKCYRRKLRPHICIWCKYGVDSNSKAMEIQKCFPPRSSNWQESFPNLWLRSQADVSLCVDRNIWTEN